jgi:hypothetical protein
VTEPERIEAALGRLPVLGALPPDSEPVPELSAVVAVADGDAVAIVGRADAAGPVFYGYRVGFPIDTRLMRLAYCPADASPYGLPVFFDVTGYELPEGSSEWSAIDWFLALPHAIADRLVDFSRVVPFGGGFELVPVPYECEAMP